MQRSKTKDEILAGAPHGHEEGEVAVNGIVVFLAALAATCLLVFVICYFLRGGMQYFVEKTNPDPTYWQKKQMSADAKGMDEKKAAYMRAKDKPAPTEEMEIQMQLDQAVQRFPQPRLQTDDAQDMAAMHEHEEHMLNDYMWIGQPGNRVTIPIDQAIEKVVASKAIKTESAGGGAQ